MALFPVTLSDP